MEHWILFQNSSEQGTNLGLDLCDPLMKMFHFAGHEGYGFLVTIFWKMLYFQTRQDASQSRLLYCHFQISDKRLEYF